MRPNVPTAFVLSSSVFAFNACSKPGYGCCKSLASSMMGAARDTPIATESWFNDEQQAISCEWQISTAMKGDGIRRAFSKFSAREWDTFNGGNTK
jgi:hypothetical protein